MDQKGIVIAGVRRLLDDRLAQKSALDTDIEHLQGTLRQLEEEDADNTITVDFGNDDIASIVAEQERAAQRKDFPAERLRGLKRLAVAKLVAEQFGGYLLTSAYRKILADSGVLKGTSQLGSIASRVLSQSDEFERVAEGLYRLKSYQSRNQEAPEGAS